MDINNFYIISTEDTTKTMHEVSDGALENHYIYQIIAEGEIRGKKLKLAFDYYIDMEGDYKTLKNQFPKNGEVLQVETIREFYILKSYKPRINSELDKYFQCSYRV